VTTQVFAKVNGSALDIAAPHLGSGRVFVATQEGQIWQVSATGQVGATPLLDISKEITSGGERGLLGLALHPRFSLDPRVFVNYTDLDGNTVIASFRFTGTEFDPASEQVILRQQQPYPNHNGGGLAFGRDGDLYIGLGDGGSGGDPLGNGQSLETFLGKMLRIDIDHPDPGKAYGIPADNPFVGRTGARPEIWAYGLRNPFRFSFDQAANDLWIGDVGQDRWEEIDVVRAGSPSGKDFGWNIAEGNHCFQPADGCNIGGLAPPISEYGHDQGCAVIGGLVYRPSTFPLLDGGYLFTDSCTATLWAIPADATSFVEPVPVGELGGSPAGFGINAQGDLLVARLDGTILKLSAASR
jgi:glucose/arabinose dehydrogenase